MHASIAALHDGGAQEPRKLKDLCQIYRVDGMNEETHLHMVCGLTE
jgi:hypothetical protein